MDTPRRTTHPALTALDAAEAGADAETVMAIHRLRTRMAVAPKKPGLYQADILRLPKPSRYAHANLLGVFEALGNTIYGTPTRLQTGHEPVHSSSSGTCVRIWPETGRWWCFSCNAGGDAVEIVRQAKGWNYKTAVAWLKSKRFVEGGR